MSYEIRQFSPENKQQVLAISLRAWAPVFEKLQPAVPPYVYDAFYPEGWRIRQSRDIELFLESNNGLIWVAIASGSVVGWVGARLHPQDNMGEIYILAVDPDHQRRGIAQALMKRAMEQMRAAGMAIVMVETGDDPGHAPSRATYERAGFERWPVARYFLKL
jgi:ribosomal protein S18 acetylase RimI-like enzyme